MCEKEDDIISLPSSPVMELALEVEDVVDFDDDKL